MRKNSVWNTETAALWHSRDGSFLSISERPLWAVLLEILGGEILPDLCFHVFCCNLWEWTWKIRWGPLDPEFGIADRSLGHLLWVFGQWSSSGFGTDRQVREIARIPVTEEWVREHYPDAGWPLIDDQMSSRPGDSGDTILL